MFFQKGGIKMPPQPRFPFQGGMGPMMGPRMMGPSRFMGPGMGPGMNPGSMGRGMMNPGQGPSLFGGMLGRGPQPRPGGGGLLARLLGRATGGGAQTAGRAATAFNAMNTAGQGAGGGGGILKLLSNPESINGFLNNTQNVLRTAQSIGPMVQQYGPLVKNLPAMWKLYKGLKDAPADESVEETSSETPIASEEPSMKARRMAQRKRSIQVDESESGDIQEQTAPVKKKKSGASVPKIYI